MSSLRRDLIEKRLWPLVLILILAIVAIPFVLAHRSQASTTFVPPVPTVAVGSSKPATDSSGGKPVSVSVERKELHRLTKVEVKREAERNPFSGTPKYAPKTKTAGDSASTSTTTTSTATNTEKDSTSPLTTAATSDPTSIGAGATVTSAGAEDGTSVSSGSGEAPTSSSTSTTTTTATMTATVTETTTAPAQTMTTTTSEPAGSPIGTGPWTVYTVDLRTASVNPVTHQVGTITTLNDLARLSPLPSVTTPKVMFTGVTDQGHEVVFALGDGVKANGKGRCLPSRSLCSAIALAAATPETFTWYASDGSPVERVIAVNRLLGTTTDSQSQAAAAFANHSAAGQCELDLGDPVQYDDTRGSVSSTTATDCRGVKSAVPFPGSGSGS